MSRLKVDLERHDVRMGAKPIRMTPKEYGILVELVRANGRVRSRSQLMAAVWGDEYAEIDNRTVDQHVARLRWRLKQHGPDPILTVTGAGYRVVEGRFESPEDVVGTVVESKRRADPSPQTTLVLKVGKLVGFKKGDKVRLA